jgi:hypothetical protein
LIRVHDRRPEFWREGAIRPADLTPARLIKTLANFAMPAYSHLLDQERERIGVVRAAGRLIGAIAKAR